MQTYEYKAVDASGKMHSGSVSVKSEKELISMLQERGQRPVNITEKQAESLLTKDFEIPFFKDKIKTIDLSVFSRQMATMLKAGMSIDRAMDVQIAQSENKAMKEALILVFNDIKKGIPMSKAMENTQSFPAIFINTIRAGEDTGDLDGSLRRMAVHYEKEGEINRKISGAMVYPIVIFCITMLVAIGMLIFILPQFAEMFDGMDAEMPGLTVWLMDVSHSMRTYWYIYVILVPFIFYLIRRALQTDRGVRFIAQFKLNGPLVSKYMQQIMTARFTRTLSTMIESGISIIEALELAANTTNNVIVEERIDGVMEDLKKGASITTQLRRTMLFPEMMLSLLAVGEETGEMSELLSQTADFYDDEFDTAITMLLGLIEPLMIVFMAGVVGLIVIAMYLPMFSVFEAAL